MGWSVGWFVHLFACLFVVDTIVVAVSCVFSLP